MKIYPITNSKISFLKRIKNMFSNCKLKLKTLTKDVFERRSRRYVEYDGKMVRSRDLPNFVGVKEDYIGVVAKRIKFYPEDEAIMKTIKDPDERMAYGRKLIREGKFIE